MCVRSSVFLCEIMLISLCYTEQVCNYGDPQRVRNVKLSRGSGSGDHTTTLAFFRGESAQTFLNFSLGTFDRV